MISLPPDGDDDFGGWVRALLSDVRRFPDGVPELVAAAGAVLAGSSPEWSCGHDVYHVALRPGEAVISWPGEGECRVPLATFAELLAASTHS